MGVVDEQGDSSSLGSKSPETLGFRATEAPFGGSPEAPSPIGEA